MVINHNFSDPDFLTWTYRHQQCSFRHGSQVFERMVAAMKNTDLLISHKKLQNMEEEEKEEAVVSTTSVTTIWGCCKYDGETESEDYMLVLQLDARSEIDIQSFLNLKGNLVDLGYFDLFGKNGTIRAIGKTMTGLYVVQPIFGVVIFLVPDDHLKNLGFSGSFSEQLHLLNAVIVSSRPDFNLFNVFTASFTGMPSTCTVGDLPPELHCPLCKEVMKDVVLTSKCCFTSFYDKYDLLPNKILRDTINRILESNNSSVCLGVHLYSLRLHPLHGLRPLNQDVSRRFTWVHN
ncbi:hypothetical protein L6452_19672 [Arctium lappa]|uniref:Uncharacterized protein n=1 Tax=Arctium lappa TaxID=4217 RepID=A0ACB9BB20_ARCLA|nr:hypothetical protein L6452_19672 [Arctium lappa]